MLISDMSSSQTRYNFLEFVKEYAIRIPLIQRDYVQGHDFTDKHKLEKRQEFIRLLMNALKRGTAYHVDFIYGTSVQNKKVQAGKNFFIPLDGQQRLTTLFLLHWILINKSGIATDEKAEALRRLEGFSYETRLSSAAFCDKLTATILEELPKGKLREIITDCSWYSNDWDYDPTITNMISMLEAMNSMIEDEFLPFVDSMWKHAQNPSTSITFDRLDMEEYGLADGLYIKMNARGKELTAFEHWKALFIQFLEDTGTDGLRIAEFKDKIEHEWAHLFWDYVYGKGESKGYPVIDDCFMSFFHYLTHLLYYAHVYSPQGGTSADYIGTVEQIHAVYKHPDNVDGLFAALDFLSKVGSKESTFFDELFKHGNEEVGDTRVRLFSKGRLNLFQRCILPRENEDFDIYEQTLFYALLRYGIKHRTTSVTPGLSNYVRVVRNLLLNTNQFNRAQVNLVSNLRITEFATYCRLIETLAATTDVRDALSESATGLGGKHAARLEKSKLDIPDRDLVCWLEDMDFCRGDIRAFDFMQHCPKDILVRDVLKFRDATDAERVRLLIASGYQGFPIGWSSFGNRYFFGKEGRWDLLFTRDHERISTALGKFIDAGCSIEDYCRKNIPSSHNFKYYALKYKEFLRSAGHWQAKDDNSSYYYFAVNGDMDDLDMIALKSYSRSPLLAYHTEPLASVVLRKLIDRDTDTFGHNRLQNCNIYNQKASLRYFGKNNELLFSMMLENKAWHIEVAPEIPQRLREKYGISNNVLTETGHMDLVEVAEAFVKEMVEEISLF